MVLFYGYDKCATCQKAKVFLVKRGIAFREYDITQTPPSKTILQSILTSGAYRLKDLFNRSGELYRELHMKEKINTLSEAALLDLLTKHGKLVRRPVITDGTLHTVGFDEARMKQVWR